MRAEVEKFREIQPLLKYVRGDVLTPDHWAELYRILGMPKMNSTELTLGSFISVAESLLKSANQVKELNARAQGFLRIQ